jgi:hypothetical protein
MSELLNDILVVLSLVLSLSLSLHIYISASLELTNCNRAVIVWRILPVGHVFCEQLVAPFGSAYQRILCTIYVVR